MGQVKQYNDVEIEQRALFSHDSGLSQSEAFEILHQEGVDEIAWSSALNAEYSQWVYFNIK